MQRSNNVKAKIEEVGLKFKFKFVVVVVLMFIPMFMQNDFV